MKLREKLALPFAVLVLAAAASGLTGLFVVSRINSSVVTMSEVTSPLLIESMALISNANAMRSIFQEGTNGVEPKDDVPAALQRLEADGRLHVAKATALAAQVGLSARLAQVSASEEQFAATLRHMTSAHTRKRRTARSVRELSDAATAELKIAEAGLHAIISQMEGRIIENEEAAKIEVQTGVATGDSVGTLFAQTVAEQVWVLQNCFRLLRATSQLQSAVQRIGSVDDATAADVIGEEIEGVFRLASSLQRKIAPRLRAAQYRPAQQGLAGALEALRSIALGADGLVAAKRELLSAAAQIKEGTSTLDAIETRYFSILADIEGAVRARNEAAKTQAGDASRIGRNVIAVLVLVSAMFAVGAALFLRRRIVAPVNDLAAHMARVGDSGVPDAISDRSTLQSRDEFGDLARAFNRMLAELAGARRELIQRSDAEIGKQVERLQAALTNMSQGLCMFDRDQRLEVSNSQYAEIYGIRPDAVRPGMLLREIIGLRVAAGSYYGDPATQADRHIAEHAGPRTSDTIVELQNGRAIHIVRRPMGDGGWVATHEDVTERRQIEAKIAHMARHDALTGLPNRRLFRERMEQAFSVLARGQSFVVHCLDLDHFKAVNDTLGHPIGDALLRAVTERLLGCIRDGDTIARLGGDEFAVVQIVADPTGEATSLAQRMIENLGRPYELDSHQVVVGVSVGMAVAPSDGREPDELLKNADLALYRAKVDGRGVYRFFEPEMDARMQARRKLELDLRRAFAAGEFEPYYQPLVNLQTGEITCFEALLRWNHPERGLVLAAEFMRVLEEIGMIGPVGEFVLREACRQAVTWPESIGVAVNLSPAQFGSPNLVQAVRSALAQSGLAADRLELEITETVLLEDTEENLATLHRLKEIGVRIAMDDFGTGYSSLSYLRSFPFDKIKIDRSFVRDLAPARRQRRDRARGRQPGP